MSGFANAIMAAAFIAAAVTLLSMPTAQVNASPRPQAEADEMQACAERPWPYLRCAGTPFGSQRIRVVVSERHTP